MTPKKVNPIAKNIWWVFAHLQSTLDEILDLTFSSLSKASSRKIPEKSSKAKKAMYKFGWFIGDIGKSYYEKYNEIKREKETDSSEK